MYDVHKQIIDRVVQLIGAETNPRRPCAELEERTGIPSANWKQVWNRKQRPTAMMIQALSLTWPRYALWLVTGISQPGQGHSSPKDCDATVVSRWSELEEVAVAATHHEMVKAASEKLAALNSKNPAPK